MRARVGVLAAVTVLLAISLAVSATSAGAHATFVGGLTTFPVNTQQNLVMSVPHERSDEYWNTEVIIAMPASWNATSCATKATWTCTVGTEDGFQVVHFTKSAGAGPAEDETFRFTDTTAPTVGSFSFPTIQGESDCVEDGCVGYT